MARVVTIGGSVAGLAAALLLARRGHEVTVVERDKSGLPAEREEAWASWRRPGVPHLRQLHIFNARGRAVLRKEAPDVYRAWLDAGAVETHLVPGDPEVVRVNSRRTTFEWVLRRAALAEPGVHLAAGVGVTGLVRDGRRVASVTTSGGPFRADLVVDASGGHAVAARWVDGISISTGHCGTVAATRWYRHTARHADFPPQLRADLGYAACVLVPADGGMFSVTFGYQRNDRALAGLRDTAGFAAAAAAVDPIAEWVAERRAAPVTGVLATGDAPNRLRRIVVDGVPAATGLVLLGDAAVCTNPGYGRGIGLALVHAAGLALALDRTGGDPAATTEAVEAFTRAELEPWYHAAVASDATRRKVAGRAIAGEPLAAIGAPGDDPDVRFARALPRAAAGDAVVQRAFQRTWHLLDHPSTLWDDPAIRALVDGVGRGSQPDPALPDHASMASLLARRSRTGR